MVRHSYRHQIHMKKITKLLENITMYLNQQFLTPKQLSKVAGLLFSMHLAISPIVQFFTRNMYHFIEKRIFRYEQKTVNKNVKEELESQRNNINIYNRYTFQPRQLTSCLLFIYYDFSSFKKFLMSNMTHDQLRLIKFCSA